MISLTVNAMGGKENVYDITVEELQSGIRIDGEKITGTLKNVTDYSGFSDDSEKQSGHFLALKVDVSEDSNVTTELVNGETGPVDMSEDHFCVYRITNKDDQKIKFTVSSGEESVTKTYDLTGLVLSPE